MHVNVAISKGMKVLLAVSMAWALAPTVAVGETAEDQIAIEETQQLVASDEEPLLDETTNGALGPGELSEEAAGSVEGEGGLDGAEEGASSAPGGSNQIVDASPEGYEADADGTQNDGAPTADNDDSGDVRTDSEEPIDLDVEGDAAGLSSDTDAEVTSADEASREDGAAQLGEEDNPADPKVEETTLPGDAQVIISLILDAGDGGRLVLRGGDAQGNLVTGPLPEPDQLGAIENLFIGESVTELAPTLPVYVSGEEGALVEFGTFGSLVGTEGLLAPRYVTFAGSGVASLGEGVFAGMSSLVEVKGLELQDTITSLPSGCFRGCVALTSLQLPSGLQQLGDSAFSGCASLTSIEVPSSVTTICARCFEGCTQLGEVHLLGEVAPQLIEPTTTFMATPMETGTGWLYVPAAGLDSYLEAWIDWEDRITIEPGTEDGLELAPMTGDRSVWVRLCGQNAYGTMQAVVQAENVFAKGRGGTVIVATGDGYWDALSASGLAGRLDAPVLITPKGSLASQTKSEIQRIRPTQIIVAGGGAAISDSVLSQLKSLCPKVSRESGKTASDTSVKLYQAGKSWGSTVIVATSDGYWDALSVAPYAYRYGAPIFLTKGSSKSDGRVLSDSALAAIRSGGFKKAVIVGGKGAVSSSVEGQLKGIGVGSVTRLSGKTALDTSAEIAKWELRQGMVTEHLTVATSNGYWDALTGAALAGKQNSVLVLVGKDGGYQALDAVYDYADQGKVPHGHVLGGKAAVSQATWDRITAGWALTSIKLSQTVIRSGSSITVTPTISGDISKISFNYGWQKDGSSADKDLWSVKKQTGAYTKDKSRGLYIGSPGTFDVYVEAVDTAGAKQTLHATLKVWGLVGLKVTTKSESSWTATADLGTAGSSAGGVSFRYTWKRTADGKTGVVREWSSDKAVTFDASKLGKVSGRYELTVEMRDSAGKVESAKASFTFAPNGKIGYQTPGNWPKVSANNVVLPSYCTGYHTYVSPSKISIDATRQQCIDAFIQRATEYLGTQYIEPYSREPGNAVDCSGLVLQCLYATGMDLEHARGTESVGGYNPYNHYWVPAQTYNSMRWYENDTFMPVSLSDLQRGDIVFYSGHVAIYIGNGKVIHSSNYMVPFNGVQISDLWHRDVIGAQRPFPA